MMGNVVGTDRLPGRRIPPLWALVVAGSVITAVSLGVRSTFGLYLDPVVDELGTGRGAFALSVAIQNIVWGLGQPAAGAVADRWGSARVLAFGGGCFLIGMVLMGRATDSLAVHATGGFVIGMAVATASFAVVLAAVGRAASPERRSLALGVVSAFGSLGQFALVPLAQWLLDGQGWRTTVAIMGAIGASVVLVAPVLRGNAADTERRDPSTSPDSPRPLRQELRRAFGSTDYLLLNGAFFVCGFHVTSIATHLPAHVGDIGLSGGIAATTLALIGLGNVFGSLAAGWLGDRHSKTRLLAGIYGLRAIVIVAFIVVPGTATTMVVFGLAMGALWLSTVPLTSGIIAQQFGTQHAGTLFGIVFLSHQIGAFIGAWVGGLLADVAGSYNPVWWIGVGLGVLAMVLHLLLDDGPVGPPPEPARRTPGLAPLGGMAAVFLAAVSLPLVTGSRSDATGSVATAGSVVAAEAERQSQDPSRYSLPYSLRYCALHPTILD